MARSPPCGIHSLLLHFIKADADNAFGYIVFRMLRPFNAFFRYRITCKPRPQLNINNKWQNHDQTRNKIWIWSRLCIQIFINLEIRLINNITPFIRICYFIFKWNKLLLLLNLKNICRFLHQLICLSHISTLH